MRRPYTRSGKQLPSADHGAKYLPTPETIARECERIREKNPRELVGFNEAPVEMRETGSGKRLNGREMP